MSFKKIFVLGVLFWVIIFVAISVVIFLPFLETRTLIQAGIIWIVDAIVTAALARSYFKQVQPGIGSGFIFGVGILVISTILDLIISVPLFIKDYGLFFNDWTLWVGWGVIIVFSILTAMAWPPKKDKKIEFKAETEIPKSEENQK